ncbi:MAG: hypothetical protein ACYC4R_02920 [Anaerolineae bacterium]
MDRTEQALSVLIERLAEESRVLLALLRLGCSLQEADRALAEEDDVVLAKAPYGAKDLRRAGHEALHAYRPGRI